MSVFRTIGVGVVITMMACPPERTTLDGRGTEHGKKELNKPRSLETPVGKIAVIKGRDGEHPGKVKPDCNPYGNAAHANPKNPKTSDMHQNEGNNPQPVDSVYVLTLCRWRRVVIEPSTEGGWQQHSLCVWL